jgi:cytochrome P450 family 150 subfamily A5
MTSDDILDHDYFGNDPDLIRDPAPWFEAAREHGPVWQEPNQGVFIVTGHEEYIQVATDTDNFSNLVVSFGPFTGVSFDAEGQDDISEMLDEKRAQIPLNNMLITFDPPKHTDHRALLRRLLTPKRVAENEAFMLRCAHELIDGFIADGRVEFNRQFAGPYTLLVVADLLGVPDEDKPELLAYFQRGRGQGVRGRSLEEELAEHGGGFVDHIAGMFERYVDERRSEPRDDIVTAIATATFPDGTLPSVDDLVALAYMLTAAGQETTAKFLCSAMCHLIHHPDQMKRLRADRAAIPDFVEEGLRMLSPVKGSFRIARRTVQLGGTTVPAGSILMISNSAANRDPACFAAPQEFDQDREDLRWHLAFGHGAHYCIGASLARSESRTGLDALFDRLDDIRLAPDAELQYVSSLNLRGLRALPLEFTAAP